MTEAEYLAFEAASAVRHEYVQGQVYVQAGASPKHNLIVANLVGLLWPATRGTGCRVVASDQRLHVGPSGVYYYPDVLVTCERILDDAMDAVDPCAVIEVLSPSTASTDRREKLLVYRGLANLQTYLIVYRDEMRVERHWRTADGGWQRQDLGSGESAAVPCLNVTLPVDSIYEGIPTGPGDPVSR
jgi:Uma2 family endonuclease